MATYIGIGFSNEMDAELAAREAAFMSKSDLNTERIDIAIVFSTIHYDPRLTLPALQTILHETKMIGCSTAGIILSRAIETRGIAVLTVCSDDIHFGTGCALGLDVQDTRQAGSILARNTLEDFGRQSRNAFMFLVDGRFEHASLLLKGIQEVLGNMFPIMGAGSCDDFHFADTFQLFKDHVLTNAAIGLLVGGHATVSVGCQHGWRPLGKPRIVDKSEGNVIHSISGKPAAQLYEEYFDKKAQDLLSEQFGQMSILYPLGIFVAGSSEYLLRNIVSIRSDGSIACQGDVPEGAEVHIMISNKDACKQAAINAAEAANKGLMGKKPLLVLIFESMARLKLLGRVANEEIENIRHIFGSSVPIIGMYSNGEIAPFQTFEKFKKPYLLNESIVVLAIG